MRSLGKSPIVILQHNPLILFFLFLKQHHFLFLLFLNLIFYFSQYPFLLNISQSSQPLSLSFSLSLSLSLSLFLSLCLSLSLVIGIFYLFLLHLHWMQSELVDSLCGNPRLAANKSGRRCSTMFLLIVVGFTLFFPISSYSWLGFLSIRVLISLSIGSR